MNKCLHAVFPALVLTLSTAAWADSMAKLRWLSGCWAAVGAAAGSGEYWMPPAGGSMLGMSRTIREGRTVAHEFILIVEDGEGGIRFVASPSGQPSASFQLVRVSDDEVVFENAEHDFPQRVIYRRLPDDGLLGRIEGVVDGEFRGLDFPMTRTACESS
jgi:hypothetical protein